MKPSCQTKYQAFLRQRNIEVQRNNHGIICRKLELNNQSHKVVEGITLPILCENLYIDE